MIQVLSWIFYSVTLQHHFFPLCFTVAADLTVKTLGQSTSSIWHSQLLLFPLGLSITHLKHPPGTNLDKGLIQNAGNSNVTVTQLLLTDFKKKKRDT